MADKVVVHKGRTNTLIIKMGINISADIFTSECRTEPTVESPLIAAWTVRFLNDGTDGQLLLTMDDVVTKGIKEAGGYMDLKRVTGGEPVPVFDRPLEVSFRGTVTE